MLGAGLTPCRSWPPRTPVIIDGCLQWLTVFGPADTSIIRLRKLHHSPRKLSRQLSRQGSRPDLQNDSQISESCDPTTVTTASLVHPLPQSTSPSISFPSAPQGRLSIVMVSEQSSSSNEPYVARPDAATTARFFPLGYKEGFSQWVGPELLGQDATVSRLLTAIASGPVSPRPLRSTAFFPSFPIFSRLPPIDKPGPRLTL
jgi:hypothetical protein